MLIDLSIAFLKLLIHAFPFTKVFVSFPLVIKKEHSILFVIIIHTLSISISSIEIIKCINYTSFIHFFLFSTATIFSCNLIQFRLSILNFNPII